MVCRNTLACLFCTAAIAVAGLALTAPSALGRSAENARISSPTGDHMDHCIKMTSACAIACGKASEHCTNMAKQGKGEHATLAALCTDCADCCASCMSFVSRNSQLSAAMAECCAKCCDQCAAECDKVTGDAMTDCAKACRDCAKACREMGKTAK